MGEETVATATTKKDGVSASAKAKISDGLSEATLPASDVTQVTSGRKSMEITKAGPQAKAPVPPKPKRHEAGDYDGGIIWSKPRELGWIRRPLVPGDYVVHNVGGDKSIILFQFAPNCSPMARFSKLLSGSQVFNFMVQKPFNVGQSHLPPFYGTLNGISGEFALSNSTAQYIGSMIFGTEYAPVVAGSGTVPILEPNPDRFGNSHYLNFNCASQIALNSWKVSLTLPICTQTDAIKRTHLNGMGVLRTIGWIAVDMAQEEYKIFGTKCDADDTSYGVSVVREIVWQNPVRSTGIGGYIPNGIGPHYNAPE